MIRIASKIWMGYLNALNKNPWRVQIIQTGLSSKNVQRFKEIREIFCKDAKRERESGDLRFLQNMNQKKDLYEIDMKFSSKLPKLNQNEINIPSAKRSQSCP